MTHLSGVALLHTCYLSLAFSHNLKQHFIGIRREIKCPVEELYVKDSGKSGDG
jgi:hypothetical protein